jgi:acyl-CoA synthetase (AMP-forming)/AMP-acid ligase II
MSGYRGIGAGAAHFAIANRLHTGDEGFFVLDEKNRQHLFVTGRQAEMFQAPGRRINPLVVDNFLYTLRGVEFASTVVFKDSITGEVSLGSYVVPLRASHITEDDVITQLREHFNSAVCPTRVKFGHHAKDGGYPSRREVEKLLQA